MDDGTLPASFLGGAVVHIRSGVAPAPDVDSGWAAPDKSRVATRTPGAVGSRDGIEAPIIPPVLFRTPVIERGKADAEAIAGGETSCGNVKRLSGKQRLATAKQLGKVHAGAE